MLPPMSPLISLPPRTSTIRLDKVTRQASQIMVSTRQLLVILVVDESPAPEMAEQIEIWS
jgi:hypothetical protein